LKEPRYLVCFDFDSIQKEYYDVVVIGSGIAGVFTALEISTDTNVAILTKETLDISNSVLAQGGIAVSLDKKDSPEQHFKDTIYAGAGLCNEETVWVLVNEAASNIYQLCDFGVNFDKSSSQEFSLSREGAHSMNRIIHAGDSTGKEVCDKLISVVRTRDNIKIFENTFVIDILTEGNKCRGVLISDKNGQIKVILTDTVVCATGGFGQLYSNTTNPEVATGDGVSMAYRAGAELTDLEFIQFHPTVFYHEENKSFLISEAVRGEGALLKNSLGERFMPKYHKLAELAPRDVVSRAIFKEMEKTGSNNVYLDITFKDKEFLINRFPNIYKTCLRYGIDMARDMIPVAPAEHYCMGGIKTDKDGRTNIEGFFACGECASNGIHGANRLASNSLLEGLVFGRIIANQINQQRKEKKSTESSIEKDPEKYTNLKKEIEAALNSDFNVALCDETDKKHGRRKLTDAEKERIKKELQEEMTKNVGIIRNKEGLSSALEKVKEFTECILNDFYCNRKVNRKLLDFEVINMLILARLIIESAIEREESRGAHYRSDFKETDDINWKRHIIKKKDK